MFYSISSDMKIKTYEKIRKKYWTINEVARELKVMTCTIRYWESEFPQIIPKKRYKSSGWRQYSEKERNFVHRIHDLLHVQKYTIEGAKQIING